MDARSTLALSHAKLQYLVTQLDLAVVLGNLKPSDHERFSVISGFPSKQYYCYSQDDCTEQQISSELTDMTKGWLTSGRGTARPSPFTSGLIGYVSYDWGEQSILGYHPKTDHEHLLIYAGLYEWSLVIDHKDQQQKLYFKDNIAPATQTKVLELVNDVASMSEPQPASFNRKLSWQPEVNLTEYKKAFDKIQAYLTAGDCYQVNYAHPHVTHEPLSRSELVDMHFALLERARAPYSAFIEASDKHRLMSYSPEQFISVTNGIIHSSPIKGTRKNTGHEEEAHYLLTSKKDQAENVMIVDLIRNDLGKICETGSISVDELFKLNSYINVHHLVSRISGKLSPNLSPFEALLKTFPGGSITGAPKKRSMEIIRELECENRGAYCGSAFYWDHLGQFDSNILIRTIEQYESQLKCWGGGGIVFDSTYKSEYQESIDKIAHIIGII